MSGRRLRDLDHAHRVGGRTTMTLHLFLGLVLVAGGAGVTTEVALAADHPVPPTAPVYTPTVAQVQAARQAAVGAADDVASVRAALVVADQRLQGAQVAAAAAGEAYDGARYRAARARAAARRAAAHADSAAEDQVRQHQAYVDSVTASLEMSPQLTALSAMSEADGIGTVLSQLTTLHTTTEALDGEYDGSRASSILADVARQQADRTRLAAAAAQAAARTARDDARRAADGAATEAAATAAERDHLIGRLATLQHVSVAVARQRQHGLEVQAAIAAQQAAALAAQQAAQQLAQQQAAAAAASASASASASLAAASSAAASASAAASSAAASATASAPPTVPPTVSPTALPTSSAPVSTTAPPAPTPTVTPTPTPTPTPPSAPPPAPSTGAAAAIAFARAQIGEPYVYGAAGPSAWDCSGLMMAAWAAGGISLPHYSVAQYDDSTPISIDDLQPGDLVFWGSSSRSSSIYHVAMYTGNGMIIEAPHPGEGVHEVSMYAWITPNLFARP